MAVTISGMFGSGHTYFAGSPVVITISGLEWPTDSSGSVTSPFTIVKVKVLYDGNTVGDFFADTGGQTSITFNISEALKTIWAGYDFGEEVGDSGGGSHTRSYRDYSLQVYTEYLNSDGRFTSSTPATFNGGQCLAGRMTEWERSLISSPADANVSSLQGSNQRFGDASTKPLSSPELVGRTSVTSWVDVSNSGTTSVIYPSTAVPGNDGVEEHAPMVLRDSVPYTDFIFVNRRGALETCSGHMLEALDIDVETTQYSLVERPSFVPKRSLMAVSSGGHKTWAMSSGFQTREWAEWWAQEFLQSGTWWMRYPSTGSNADRFVPAIVEPTKKSVNIYDKTKQQMPHVDFTVTLALEG